MLWLLLWEAALPGEINNLSALAQYHCKEFPLDSLLRLAEGRLAAKFGIRFLELDQYIRKFVGEDKVYSRAQYASEEDEDAEQKSQEARDWAVQDYLAGLNECGVHWSERNLYAVWRLYRFMVNHDYFYEWLRGKVRGLTGYQSLKNNAILDTEYRSGERFKIQKVISLEEYRKMEGEYFQESVAVLIDFVKATAAILINGNYTRDGLPLLYFSLHSVRLAPSPFTAHNFSLQVAGKTLQFMGVTIPGVPLIIAGRMKSFAWAFTGYRVDRSNIQKRQIYKGRYFNQQREQWVKVKNTTQKYEIHGLDVEYEQHYLQSEYGPFFKRQFGKDKEAEELKVTWEDEPRVRTLFSQVLAIAADGNIPQQTLEFPFAALFIAKDNDIAAIFCQPHKPLSFIYPELSVDFAKVRNIRVVNPANGIIVAHNEHFTAGSFKGYLKGQAHHWRDQVLMSMAKDWKFKRVTAEQFANSIVDMPNPLFKRRFQHMLIWYRRFKHSFFQGEAWRKQIDGLITEMSRFDGRFRRDDPAALRVLLWDWFFKEQKFDQLSDRKDVLRLIRHRLLTEQYYTNSFQIWDKTSFSECNTTEWIFEYQVQMNYQEHNSSCVFNLMRALNKTYVFLKERGTGNLSAFAHEERISLQDLLAGNALEPPEHEELTAMFRRRESKSVEMLSFGKEGLFLQAGTRKVAVK